MNVVFAVLKVKCNEIGTEINILANLWALNNPALKETNLDVAQAFIDPWEMQSSLGHPKRDLQIKAKNGTQSFYLFP